MWVIILVHKNCVGALHLQQPSAQLEGVQLIPHFMYLVSSCFYLLLNFNFFWKQFVSFNWMLVISVSDHFIPHHKFPSTARTDTTYLCYLRNGKVNEELLPILAE